MSIVGRCAGITGDARKRIAYLFDYAKNRSWFGSVANDFAALDTYKITVVRDHRSAYVKTDSTLLGLSSVPRGPPERKPSASTSAILQITCRNIRGPPVWQGRSREQLILPNLKGDMKCPC